LAKKHKYLKYLADGAKSSKGASNLGNLAEMNKSLTKRAQPSVAWKPSYLVQKPSYWSGLENAFNVYGYFKPKYRFVNPRLADARALYEDWAAVGAGLERALQDFEKAQGVASQGRLFDPAGLDKSA
jgi:hypothetical protein